MLAQRETQLLTLCGFMLLAGCGTDDQSPQPPVAISPTPSPTPTPTPTPTPAATFAPLGEEVATPIFTLSPREGLQFEYDQLTKTYRFRIGQSDWRAVVTDGNGGSVPSSGIEEREYFQPLYSANISRDSINYESSAVLFLSSNVTHAALGEPGAELSDIKSLDNFVGHAVGMSSWEENCWGSTRVEYDLLLGMNSATSGRMSGGRTYWDCNPIPDLGGPSFAGAIENGIFVGRFETEVEGENFIRIRLTGTADREAIGTFRYPVSIGGKPEYVQGVVILRR